MAGVLKVQTAPGVWTSVGGQGTPGLTQDVLHVGTAAPVDPTVELWWDDDEPLPSTFSQADTDLLYVPLSTDLLTPSEADERYIKYTGTTLDVPITGTLWSHIPVNGAANLVLKNLDDTPHLAFHTAVGAQMGALQANSTYVRLSAMATLNLSLYTASGQRMWISGTSGHVHVDTNYFYVGGSPNSTPFTAGVLIRPDGPILGRIETAGTSNSAMYRSSAANAINQVFIGFYAGAAGVVGANIGKIWMPTLTTIAYVTTSDPRTKTPPPGTRGISNAVDRVRQLGATAWVGQHLDADGNPDGVDWDLLSSHDIQDAAPYVVSGERDAVATQEDVDAGNASAVGDPIYQMVGFADLVPLVVAALSQVIDRVTALEGA